jgi:hypothetical protein
LEGERKNMNTVKRWLAGFLSFAMIFTCAPFSNLTVLAADKDVVEVTIGNEKTTYESFDEAITEANTKSSVGQNVTIKLLADADTGYHWIRVPMTIEFNSHKLVNNDNLIAWYDYNGDELCRGDSFSGQKLTKITFALHDPSYTYNWVSDEYGAYVDSIDVVCPNNCDPEAPDVTGDYNFNPDTWQWEYYEGDELKSTYDERAGYVLKESDDYGEPNPGFVYKGTKIQHKDGVPVVKAEIIRKSDKKVVDPKSIEVKEASDEDLGKLGKEIAEGQAFAEWEDLDEVADEKFGDWLEAQDVLEDANEAVTETRAARNAIDFRTNWQAWQTANAAYQTALATQRQAAAAEQAAEQAYNNAADDANDAWDAYKAIKDEDDESKFIKYVSTTPATCTEYGSKWFKVTVTAPDDTVVFDDLMEDPQAVAKLAHTPGKLAAVEFLKQNDTAYDTEAEAATAVNNVVKITADENGKFHYWSWIRVDVDADWSNTNAVEVDITEHVKDALDTSGTYKYRPIFLCDREDEPETEITPDEDPDPVHPIENASNNDEYVEATTGETVGKYSTCTQWNYKTEDITCEYSKVKGDNVKSQKTIKLIVTPNTINKAEADFSHEKDGKYYNPITDPKCWREGLAEFGCSICKAIDPYPTETIEKLKDHTFGVYPNDKDDLTLRDDTQDAINVVDTNLKETHEWSLSEDKRTVTVDPTCTENGGIYKFCKNGPVSASGTGHWALYEEKKATGHTYSNVPLEGSAFSENTKDPYDEDEDYVYTAILKCETDGCDAQKPVRYHSIKGTDTALDVYEAVIIEDQDQGIDCKTPAKTIYTVKGLNDKNKKPITTAYVKSDRTKAPHKPKATKWTWSDDFKAVVIEGTCEVCGKKKTTADVMTTQETTEDGITTFTATYGDETRTKQAYSLKDAVVTYDTSLLTDGNLVASDSNWVGEIGEVDGYGVYGAAPQVPNVTVTINGTVINPDLYKATWTYSRYYRTAEVEVDWTEDVKASTAAEHVEAAKSADPFQLTALKQIVDQDFDLYANDEKVDDWTNDYDPSVTYTIKAASTPSDVTVKYAVLDKELKSDEGAAALQRKIEALTFDQDQVKFKEVTNKYVYAQMTKDGYTTWTEYVGNVVIEPLEINVFVNNLEMIVGETPVLEKQAYNANTDKKVSIDWDAEKFIFASAGGTAFEDLKAGTYLIWAEAPNYKIANANSTGDNRIGTIVVKPKTDAQTTADDIVKAFKEADTDEKMAAAYAAYLAITDKDVKAIVDAAIAADKELKAKVEACKAAKEEADKKAAEKKAVDDAKTAANSALTAANAYASDATIKALIDALNAALAKNDTAAIKDATKKLNDAVASKKATPVTKKADNVKLSPSKKKVKASTLKKKSVKFKVKATADSKLKVTVKRVKKGSSKKLTYKSGKITVKKGTKKGTYKIKLKLTTKGNANYKAYSKTKTYKVTVK